MKKRVITAVLFTVFCTGLFAANPDLEFRFGGLVGLGFNFSNRADTFDTPMVDFGWTVGAQLEMEIIEYLALELPITFGNLGSRGQMNPSGSSSYYRGSYGLYIEGDILVRGQYPVGPGKILGFAGFGVQSTLGGVGSFTDSDTVYSVSYPKNENLLQLVIPVGLGYSFPFKDGTLRFDARMSIPVVAFYFNGVTAVDNYNDRYFVARITGIYSLSF